MIFYKSTRGNEQQLTGAQAIIKGLSEDGGLFVPTNFPKLNRDINWGMGKSYQEIAAWIIGAFFDDYTKGQIENCINGAYDDKFEAKEIAPIKKVGDTFFLELYHGKTAAFKDMALSILPYLLTTAIKKEKENKKICILAATSGDTGKAALEGFANVRGTEIVVFYPENGVSQVQKRQMITQEGKNVHVFAIKGNFDNAQTGVKMIFKDEQFKEQLAQKNVKLSSANSINIGRLVPQVAYYVYSYAKLLEKGEIKQGDKINVVVPTGNFGNILAAYYAKQLGVPVKKFICASNENRVLTDFFNTGEYNTNRSFHLTNSPSMDILISSNLERLLYHLSGDNGKQIASLMNSLDTDKMYQVDAIVKNGMKDFYGGCATVDETNQAIRDMYLEKGYLMDTHTAVAYRVYENYKAQTSDTTPAIIASTASPYKFADSVASSIGLEKEENGFKAIESINSFTGIEIPKGLQALDKKTVLHKETIEIADMEKKVFACIE